jgi:hypothetical protein
LEWRKLVLAGLENVFLPSLDSSQLVTELFGSFYSSCVLKYLNNLFNKYFSFVYVLFLFFARVPRPPSDEAFVKSGKQLGSQAGKQAGVCIAYLALTGYVGRQQQEIGGCEKSAKKETFLTRGTKNVSSFGSG